MDVLKPLKSLATNVRAMLTAWKETTSVDCKTLSELKDSIDKYIYGDLDVTVRKLSNEADDSYKMDDRYKNYMLLNFHQNEDIWSSCSKIGSNSFAYRSIIYCKSLLCDASIKRAFYQCSDLIAVEPLPIDDNVTSMQECFLSCRNLMLITFNSGTMRKVVDITGAFNGCSSLTSLTFPEGSLAAVTSLGYAFNGCSSLTSLTFPEGSLGAVTNLGTAFYSCSSLTSLTFPEGSLGAVTNLGYAFQGCSSLTSLTFPEGSLGAVTNLGTAFYNCWKVKTITFPTSMVYKGTSLSQTFAECRVLTEINLPPCEKPIDSMREICYNGFAVTAINFPEGFTLAEGANISWAFTHMKSCQVIDLASFGRLGNIRNTFYDNTGVRTISIDASVAVSDNTLAQDTFHGATKLETVSLVSTAKLQNFGNIFYGCSSLTTITGLDFSSLVLTQAGVKEYYTSCAATNLASAFAASIQGIFQGCTALTSCVISGTIYRSGISIKSCTSMDAPSLYSFIVALYDWETNAEAKETDDADHIFYMTAAQQETLMAYAGELNDDGDMISGADVIDRAIGYGWTLTA